MKKELVGLYAIKTEDKVSIVWLDEEDNVSYTQNLYLKKYDEKIKGYVPDDEIYNETIENLKTLGTTLKTVEDDAASLKHELHVRGTYASFKNLGVFFEKIDPKLGRKLQKGTVKAPLASISEYNSDFGPLSVNFGVTIDDKLYRISQLLYVENDDELPQKISLKYTNSQINQQLKILESGSLDGKVAEKVKDVVVDALKFTRTEKLKELKEKFNIDVEKILDAGEEIPNLELEVRAEYAEGFKTYFLVAELAEDETGE